jgi:DNA primase
MYLEIDKIKREVTMSMVLEYYGIRLRKSSEHRLAGACPIHQGDNPNAFQVDTEKNLFHCFSHCGGGSIFDFVMKKEKLSFYRAASMIYNVFYSKNILPPTPVKLKLQFRHPYLEKRNISAPMARFFQMGFCDSGMMKQRIAIPICDLDKNTVAYCGRAIDDHLLPKYLFPKNFRKSDYLFNLQNIISGCPKPVFIVEGFFDCIHICSLGFAAVAIMGTTISTQQLTLLKQIDRSYILMLDGDQAGQIAMTRVKNILEKEHISCKCVYLDDSQEPEMLSQHELQNFASLCFFK